MTSRVAVAILVWWIPLVKGISKYINSKSWEETREDVKAVSLVILYVALASWFLYAAVTFLIRFTEHITS